MIRIFRLFLLSLLVFSLSSCMKDDTSDCRHGVRLKFYRFLNGKPVGFQNQDADLVNVYVFDDRGLYLENHSVAGRELLNGNEMLVPLKAGRYTLIAWAGKLDDYTVASKNQSGGYSPLEKGVTQIEQLRFYVKGAEISETFDPNKVVESTHPNNLYYGRLENITTLSTNITEHRVDLSRNTKEIRVKVTGVANIFHSAYSAPGEVASKATDDHPLSVYCIATNGMYDYLNDIDARSYPIRYLSGEALFSNDTFSVSSKVLRVLLRGDLRIRVMAMETRKLIIDQSAMELIAKSAKYTTQEELDKEEVLTFEFHISDNLDVTVIVNGWKVIDVIARI